MTPRVNPAFRALIPPLTEPERSELEASLLRDGCRDALVVWQAHGILLDGHNRLDICERLGLDYCVTEVDLPDREAARAWVVRNQFGRRNLTPFQRVELALLLEPGLAAEAKERQRRSGGRAPVPQNSAEPRDTRQALAAAARVSHDTVSKVKRILADADEETLAAARTGELSIHATYQRTKRAATERKRQTRRQRNGDVVANAPDLDAALADGARFTTILADPPWRYGGDQDWDPYGRGRPEYASMSAEEVCALPVADLADEDSHLYLWTPSRLMRDAFGVVEAWGFRFAGVLTWCKPRLGMGRYFRGTTEHVLFGVRGSLDLKRKDVGTWFQAPAGKHSEKPEQFHELVESCSPGPYLELFARRKRDGWSAWGAEA